jgi:(1->4)-alpha-D-glucan 1-alpha-D-glucosylmutase
MLFLQNLIGAWPTQPQEMPQLRERLTEYMVKAAKEAKVNTSWIQEDRRWEDAIRGFVEGFFALPPKHPLWKVLAPFAQRVAEIGLHNSLAQVLLKTASPGAPDFYQGTEMWDLSLVDPDNRRPVDFELRRRALNQLRESSLLRPQLAAELYGRWRDGCIKLFVTQAALQARRANGDLFGQGSYKPLFPQGPRASNLCAFARTAGGKLAVVVVPRLVAQLLEGARLPPQQFAGTFVPVEEAAPGEKLRDVLTGEERQARPEGFAVDELFSTLPVALLMR